MLYTADPLEPAQLYFREVSEMTPLERLKEMIGKLSPQDLAELRAWVSAQDLPGRDAPQGTTRPRT